MQHALGPSGSGASTCFWGRKEGILPSRTAKRLEALEQALAVVQHGRGWIHRTDRRLDGAGRTRPFSSWEVHHEHVVG